MGGNRLCDMLGIERPIIQAPMGWIARSQLASAVSNAGGLGIIETSSGELDNIRIVIARMRELTDKPFGVDLLSAQPESLTAAIDVIIANGAKAFVAGLGVPYPIVKQLKDNGVLVFAVIGKVDHAVKAEQAGCDGVIAQGTEGGGHTGQVASVALWPQVVDAVKIPVVAAGGLYDGRGLAAALALGCQGVWMGTRFIASKEAHAGQLYKDAIVEMNEADTTISRGFTGKTLRALKNATTEKYEKEATKPFPAQAMESAQLNRLGPIAGVTENLDRDTMCFAVGQGGGGVRQVLSCAEIVTQTLAEAEATLGRIGKLAA